MCTFEDKPKTIQKTAASHSALPARLYREQSLQVNSSVHRQPAAMGAIQRLSDANTSRGKADSTFAETARFSHGFNQTPVYAAALVPVTRGRSPHEPDLASMQDVSPSFASDLRETPLFLGSQTSDLASANYAPAKCRPKDPDTAGEDADTDVDETPTFTSSGFDMEDFAISASPAPAPGVLPPAFPSVPPPVAASPPVAAPRPAAAKHVTPTFILDKKEDPRSNTNPSTQSKSPPTFVGNAVGDGKTWRYELNSVELKGKIRIVYFTDDHYPAPTPTDDSGTLSNVVETNWKAIVDDLEKNKEGVPKFWSAYRAEDVHESFHWEVEWQGEMKKELIKAENDIALLSIGVDKAATSADAERVLAPKAAKIFNDAMARADSSYQALPDSPGAPAYKAQIPVVTALKNRVADYAKTNKW